MYQITEPSVNVGLVLQKYKILEEMVKSLSPIMHQEFHCSEDRDEFLNLRRQNKFREKINRFMRRVIKETPVENEDTLTFIAHYLCLTQGSDSLEYVLEIVFRERNNIALLGPGGITLLHLACYIGDQEVLRSLPYFDIIFHNAKDIDGLTPLMVLVLSPTAMGDGTLNNARYICRRLLKFCKDINTGDNTVRSALHMACYRGTVIAVKELLAAGATTNETDADGRSALHMACYNGNVNVVKELLAAGASVNDRDTDGSSALHMACYNGNVNVFKELLAAGASVNDRDTDGRSALHMACYNGNVNVFKELLAAGASVNDRDTDGRSALHMAYHSGHLDVVKELLASGADVHTRDSGGLFPIFYLQTQDGGLSENILATVIRILSDGNINSSDENSKTALHWACFDGNYPTVEFLFTAGAKITITEDEGRGPLSLLLEGIRDRGKWTETESDLMKILIMHGDDINATDGKANSAKSLAHQYGDFEFDNEVGGKNNDFRGSSLIRLLLEEVDDNYQSTEKKTSLPIIFFQGNIHAVNTAILSHALKEMLCNDVKKVILFFLEGIRLRNKWTNNDDEILRVVLSRDNVNSTDTSGRTALHLACFYGSYAAVKFLMSLKVDTKIKDVKRDTPLSYVLRGARKDLSRDYSDIIALLIQMSDCGTELREQDILSIALMLEKLLDIYKTAPTVSNILAIFLETIGQENRWTEVHTALVAFFLDQGIDPDSVDSQGNSVLHWSYVHKNENLVKCALFHEALRNKKNKHNLDPFFTYVQQLEKCKLTVKDGTILMLLIHDEIDTATRVADEEPLLHWACNKLHPELVDWLLSRGANCMSRDKSGLTSLELVFESTRFNRLWTNDHRNIVGHCIKHGADINSKNQCGETLLHLACSINFTEAINELHNREASWIERNIENKVPVQVLIEGLAKRSISSRTMDNLILSMLEYTFQAQPMMPFNNQFFTNLEDILTDRRWIEIIQMVKSYLQQPPTLEMLCIGHLRHCIAKCNPSKSSNQSISKLTDQPRILSRLVNDGVPNKIVKKIQLSASFIEITEQLACCLMQQNIEEYDESIDKQGQEYISPDDIWNETISDTSDSDLSCASSDDDEDKKEENKTSFGGDATTDGLKAATGTVTSDNCTSCHGADTMDRENEILFDLNTVDKVNYLSLWYGQDTVDTDLTLRIMVSLMPLFGKCVARNFINMDCKERSIGAEIKLIGRKLSITLDHANICNDIHEHKVRHEENNILNAVTSMLKIFLGTQQLSCQIEMCGSVRNGIKVGQLDEFDFSVILSDHNLDLKQKYSQFEIQHTPGDELTVDVKGRLFDAVSSAIRGLPRPDNPHLKGVYVERCYKYKTAPGLCIKLAWYCDNDHKHHLDIDLTPVIKMDKPLEEVWQAPDYFSQGVFNDIRKELLKCVSHLVQDTSSPNRAICSLTFNQCDKVMFSYMDKISPNIKNVMRFLKYVRDVVFPKVMKYSRPESVETSGGRDGQLVSSYIIQQLLYFEVHRHPEPSDWHDDQLSDRVSAILEGLMLEEYRSFYTNKPVSTLDIVTSDRARVEKHLHRDVRYVLKLLSTLKQRFSSPDHCMIASLQRRLAHDTSEEAVYVMPPSCGLPLKRYKRWELVHEAHKIRKGIEIGEYDNIYYYQTLAVDVNSLQSSVVCGLLDYCLQRVER